MSTGLRSSGLSRQTAMAGSAGRLAARLLPLLALGLALALAVLACGCAAQSNPGTLPGADAQATTHRVHVVRHGWHSGIVVRAADVPMQAWPARREFADAEYLEVGWGDRAYYQAPDPSAWLGLRALLWPTRPPARAYRNFQRTPRPVRKARDNPQPPAPSTQCAATGRPYPRRTVGTPPPDRPPTNAHLSIRPGRPSGFQIRCSCRLPDSPRAQDAVLLPCGLVLPPGRAGRRSWRTPG